MDFINPDLERDDHENSTRERSLKDPVDLFDSDSERDEDENSPVDLFNLDSERGEDENSARARASKIQRTCSILTRNEAKTRTQREQGHQRSSGLVQP